MKKFSVNKNIDVDVLKAVFEKKQKIQIPNILNQSDAQILSEHLVGMPEWNLVFNTQSKHYDLSASGFAAIDLNEQIQLKKAIYASAAYKFGYMYKNYPIFDLVNQDNCSELLHAFYNFLNSDDFLNMARSITGFENIEFVDAQATCYESGHFLTSHDDQVAGKNRLAAYVLNLSPSWNPDWGGNLLFYDNDSIDDAFVPKFNSLSLFAVGTPHAVSMLTPFSVKPRLSITGWLRYR